MKRRARVPKKHRPESWGVLYSPTASAVRIGWANNLVTKTPKRVQFRMRVGSLRDGSFEWRPTPNAPWQ
jgi:hypothetical protein